MIEEKTASTPIIVSILIINLLFASQVHAAPAYGTKLPKRNHFVFGGQSYIVYEKDLEGNNGDMKSSQNFLLISYGLTDWLSVDTKGGTGSIRHTSNGANEIDYQTYLGGGYGFRIKFLDDDNLKAVLGFQHISIHPKTSTVVTATSNKKNKVVLDDWQFSLLASYDLGLFTPYIGGRWARMDLIHWEDDNRNRIKVDEDKRYGAILGADFPLSERAWINIEGNFADMTAFASSINFQF